MKISIITLFPEMFEPVLNTSILKRAQTKGKVQFEFINLRDFGEGVHQIVDDRPYGGGAGMVLKADILAKALNSTKIDRSSTKGRVVYMSAGAQVYQQAKAQEFSKLDHLVIICGHYEGVDQRFIDKYVDEEISIGDYVLTGGEIPAMIITDSIVRLIPGVLEKSDAIVEESFSLTLDPNHSTLLEYPHYTRPDSFEGLGVPEVLKSGNHKRISDWRSAQALEKTRKIRPDLLQEKP